jgi:hypothetical protein
MHAGKHQAGDAAQGLVFITKECFSEQLDRNNRPRNYWPVGLKVPASWPNSVGLLTSCPTERRWDRLVANTLKVGSGSLHFLRAVGRVETILSGVSRFTSTWKKCFS